MDCVRRRHNQRERSLARAHFTKLCAMQLVSRILFYTFGMLFGVPIATDAGTGTEWQTNAENKKYKIVAHMERADDIK